MSAESNPIKRGLLVSLLLVIVTGPYWWPGPGGPIDRAQQAWSLARDQNLQDERMERLEAALLELRAIIDPEGGEAPVGGQLWYLEERRPVEDKLRAAEAEVRRLSTELANARRALTESTAVTRSLAKRLADAETRYWPSRPHEPTDSAPELPLPPRPEAGP